MIRGNDLIAQTAPLLEKVKKCITRDHSQKADLAQLPIAIPVGETRLDGQLALFTGVGLVHYRPSKVEPKKKPNAHLDIWIEHLALQLSAWPGPKKSYLIGEDSVWRFNEVPNAKDLLQELLVCYFQGQQEPLPFFPVSSFAYAMCYAKKPETAPDLALKSWEGDEDSDFNKGEKENAYFDLCFRNQDSPLNEKFEELAMRIVNPLLQYQEKL